MADRPDLDEALAAGRSRAVFHAPAPSRHREHLTWIDGAKRPDTRARRSAGTVERLKSPS